MIYAAPCTTETKRKLRAIPAQTNIENVPALLFLGEDGGVPPGSPRTFAMEWLGSGCAKEALEKIQQPQTD
jgi:hypothetical protein